MLVLHRPIEPTHRPIDPTAQSGHFETEFRCPLLRVKRTSAVHFAGLDHQLAVRVTSSSSSSSGTKPLPPHVGHCRSSSVPFSMTPSPLQSGQVLVFTCASLWASSRAQTQCNAPGKHRQLSDVGQLGVMRSKMSAFGVKRTLLGGASMSAYDPKRTSDCFWLWRLLSHSSAPCT